MALPNFVYIGPAKAGSSWLHETLAHHPDICVPQAKDLHFFDRYFDRGLAWYTAQFRGATADQAVVGEVCQSYLASRQAPQRMAECLGDDVRLMVTLRDPVQRAFSHYLYARRQGKQLGTFSDALQSRRSLIGQSRYATQLRRYLRYFDRERIYVAVFDDLRRDPQRFLDRLLAWLDVPPRTLDPALRAARLPASRARSKPAATVLRRAAVWARDHDGAGLVGRAKRSPLVQRTFYKPLDDESPRLTQDDATYIQTRLNSEIIDLEQLFDLPLRQRWGWPLA